MVPMEDSGTHREVWTLFSVGSGEPLVIAKEGQVRSRAGFPSFSFPWSPAQ